jgi:hypothetical protein
MDNQMEGINYKTEIFCLRATAILLITFAVGRFIAAFRDK